MPDMSEERKPHVWPWIPALLIGLPVFYVGSFGPACWLTADPRPIDPLRSVEPPRGMLIYWPLGHLADKGPNAVMQWLQWWMYFGAKKGTTVSVPTDLNGSGFGICFG